MHEHELFHRLFPETAKFIRDYIDPWIALNRRSARAMTIPLTGCGLAILWGTKNIIALMLR